MALTTTAQVIKKLRNDLANSTTQLFELSQPVPAGAPQKPATSPLHTGMLAGTISYIEDFLVELGEPRTKMKAELRGDKVVILETRDWHPAKLD